MGDNRFDRNLEMKWKNLYEEIVHNLNREWESISRHYHRFPETTIENIRNNGLLMALPRLLPLAKELQEDETLHCLMPWQHHGVLDLLLMDWEKQTSRAFISILPDTLPNENNQFQVSLYDGNLPFSARPPKIIQSVPIGEVRSLIHAELQVRAVK